MGRRLTRMLALAPLQIRLVPVNRSPSGCGDVLHPRGHHFVLCVFGAGVPKILPASGFPVVAEGH